MVNEFNREINMGVFRWLGSRPGKVINYGKKVVAADEIKGGGKFISDMMGKLGKSSGSGRQETFANAYKRLNLNEEKLKKSYTFYFWRFNIFAFFLGIGVVFSAYFIMQHSLTVLPLIGFVLVCLSQLFNASFRMTQIRYREMLPIIFWLKNPSEWWAKPFEVKNDHSSQKIRNTTKTSDKNRKNNVLDGNDRFSSNRFDKNK